MNKPSTTGRMAFQFRRLERIDTQVTQRSVNLLEALYFSRFLLLLLSPSGKGDRDVAQIFLLSDSFPAASGAGGTDLIEGHLVLI
jgi:hypothetical protein